MANQLDFYALTARMLLLLIQQQLFIEQDWIKPYWKSLIIENSKNFTIWQLMSPTDWNLTPGLLCPRKKEELFY